MATFAQSSDSVDEAEQDQGDAWSRTFDEQMRQQLVDEDRRAWRMVCLLLVTIVVGGVLLGALGATAAWLNLD